ncbi:MAG: hypothetical protein L0Y56_01740, partial [Nitrospira sp.]|nr:hypothetical protein [Nitrospira sp.]
MIARAVRLIWVVLAEMAILLNLAALPGPELIEDGTLSGGWIPIEDEEIIHKLQFPEMYPPVLYLPDLRTLPPTNLLLQILRGQGVTRLRFTNTIWNSGPGDLEMRAKPFPVPGAVHVSQYILREDGEGVLQEAGVFDYHDIHGHWHWEGFSIYQIWSLTPAGNLNRIVASSDKVGYCLIDMAPY